MEKIRIGIVGAGNIAANAHMPAYAVCDKAEVVAVADLNLERAQSFAKRFGIPNAYASVEDMLAAEQLDAVDVCTWNNGHAPVTIAAAKAGKHILCEKPMANTLAEGKAMVDAIEKAGVKSLVDFIYTKCPANVLAKELMDSGKLGDFVTFRGEFDCSYCADPNTPATWRQLAATAGTGALGDLTAHIVSLSDMIVGKKIVEVFASWDTPYKQRPDARDRSKMLDIDTDDQIYVIVKYEDGRIGSMSSSRVSVARPVSLAYEIQGSKGSVKFEMTRINELLYYSNDCDPKERGYKIIKGNTRNGDYSNFCGTDEQGISYNEIMSIQAHDILTAITEDRKVDIDIAYGHYVDTILEAMATSAREGRWVKVSEMEA